MESATRGTAEPHQSTEESSATIEKRRQIEKNQAALKLLREWMADTSGYDEENWPKVKQIIEENRMSERKRFAD